jgi:hypothetical protein
VQQRDYLLLLVVGQQVRLVQQDHVCKLHLQRERERERESVCVCVPWTSTAQRKS